MLAGAAGDLLADHGDPAVAAGPAKEQNNGGAAVALPANLLPVHGARRGHVRVDLP